MLILTRRPVESIYIGDEVTVTVLGVVGNQVRFGIEAPRSIVIDRAEIHERKKRAAMAHGPGSNGPGSNGQAPPGNPANGVTPGHVANGNLAPGHGTHGAEVNGNVNGNSQRHLSEDDSEDATAYGNGNVATLKLHR
jgi:carbon storage regulator